MPGFGEPPKMHMESIEENPRKSPADMVASNIDPDKTFAEIFGTDAKPKTAQGPTAEIGQVRSMRLPANWVEGETVHRSTAITRQYFVRSKDTDGNLVDNKDVQINFHYRGNRLSENASKAFRALIDDAPVNGSKAVSQSDLQKPPLAELLRDLGHKNTFKIHAARVQQLNGEPVLVIEGQYSNYPVSAQVVYVDAERNNRGSLPAPVQEITYIAPTRDFPKYFLDAKKALDSIIWKH